MKKGTQSYSIGNFDVRRKTVSASQTEWVKIGEAQAEREPPQIVQATVEGVDLNEWAKRNRDFIDQKLLKHGAILFRDFDVSLVARFEDFIRTTSGEPMEYLDRATPRSVVNGNIYSSTDYPPNHHIELHNESSYAFTWPRRIFFFCVKSAKEGGETSIADCRRLFNRIDPTIRERFIRKKVMYVRNFGDSLGMRWQVVFQTDNMETVLEYCRKNHIKVEQKANGGLRTYQVREAVIKHPETGEIVWFNQATAFHLSTLAPTLREALLTQCREEDVPKNAYYGDGSPIEASVLDAIRDAYRKETILFPWQNGDILMLDNILMAHGRQPYVGPRTVVAGIAGPTNWDMISTS
jgi:alpha-ketoglutarate-dependent taurine dioxygenase